MNGTRRDFLRGTAWMGAAAMAAGCMSDPLKVSGTAGALMQGAALKPMKKVRVAVIGVGSRGSGAVNRLSMIPGTEVVCICDLFQDRIDARLKWLQANGKPLPRKTFVGPQSYKRACEMDDVDVVYSVTPWYIHEQVASYAMEHGKVALTEVPGCLTIDECWKLVETSEKTHMPCMMLENCCYGEYEMLAFNLCKLGLFGDLVHGEAGYIHDQRDLQYGSRYHSIAGDPIAAERGRPGWALDIYSKHGGNYYPTHGLGPVAKCMDINHGDNFDFLVSMDSLQANYHRYGREMYTDWRKDYKVKMGDMNLSLIKTKLGRTILLEHDVSSPRPYSRINLVSGTKGMLMSYPDLYVTFESKCGDPATHAYFKDDKLLQVRENYKHPFWKMAGEIAKKVGGHGGMDFIMDLRWSYCLQNGLPLDTDVYDLAAWSAMVELTERSCAMNSRPVDCPDFTRGAWRRPRSPSPWRRWTPRNSPATSLARRRTRRRRSPPRPRAFPLDKTQKIEIKQHMNINLSRRNFLVGTSAFSLATLANPIAICAAKPNLRFGVLSDIHITDWTSTEILRKTLQYFRDQDVDAVLIAGDMADHGILPQLQNVAKAWFSVFPDDKGLGGKKVERLFIYGNHDPEGLAYRDAAMDKAFKAMTLSYEEAEKFVLKKYGLKKAWEECFHEAYTPIYTKNVKGYDFIGGHWDPANGSGWGVGSVHRRMDEGECVEDRHLKALLQFPAPASAGYRLRRRQLG